jgi:hypothetical protein
MSFYVKHSAMGDLFVSVQETVDPAKRATLLRALEGEFSVHYLMELERLCYDLKILGESTGQISESLGLSERKVKKFINNHAATAGEWSPLQRRNAVGALDISHLVARRSEHLSQPEGTRRRVVVPAS